MQNQKRKEEAQEEMKHGDTIMALLIFLAFNAFLMFQVDGLTPKLWLMGWILSILAGAAYFAKAEGKKP